jgi:hypothetical protein
MISFTMNKMNQIENQMQKEQQKEEEKIVNRVNVGNLFETIGAIKSKPSIAKFNFCAKG